MPTYGDESTGYNPLVVFFYSNKIKSMMVDYSVREMGCFGDYFDAAPPDKTIRGNGTTTFLFHVPQCILFRQTNIFTSTRIA